MNALLPPTPTRDVQKWMPVEDALKACRAAAKTAMQGDAYSADDRLEVAATLMLKVLERAALHADAAGNTRDFLPAKYCGFDFLVKRAANERRAMDDRRAKLAQESSEDSSEDDAPTSKLPVHGSVTADEVSPVNDGTATGARRAALDMLADAGLWDGRRAWHLTANARAHVQRSEYPQGTLFDERRPAARTPSVRAKAPTGPVWTLAYSVARMTAPTPDETAEGVTLDAWMSGKLADAIALELELTPATYRQHISRACKLLRTLPGSSLRSWVDALNITGYGWSAPDGAARMDERTRPDEVAPVVFHRGAVHKRKTVLGSDWSRPYLPTLQRNGMPSVAEGRDRNGKPTTASLKLDPLPPLTRARLDKAARMRRQRADAKTPQERRAAREAAGLPIES